MKYPRKALADDSRRRRQAAPRRRHALPGVLAGVSLLGLLAAVLPAQPAARGRKTTAGARATSRPAPKPHATVPPPSKSTPSKSTPGKPPPDIRQRGLKSNQSSKRNNGSATVLSGTICLIHLFLSDRTSSWSPQDKAIIRNRMAVALQFLRRQGKRYSAKFRFVEPTAKDVHLPTDIPIDMFDNHTWIETATRQAGYRGAVDMALRVKTAYKAKHSIILAHVNRKATSFNLTYYSGVHPSFFAERVVMYSRYPDGRPTCAASYAHEILHAFGAGELYFPFDEHPTRKQLARKYFPHDVMLRVDYDINKLRIGEYTAYRIGWLETLKQQHESFED